MHHHYFNILQTPEHLNNQMKFHITDFLHSLLKLNTTDIL